MQIVNTHQVPREPRVSPLFTSADVTVQVLVPEGGDFSMSIVNFGKNVRNKFHVHESDQILIVTEGKGIVATEKEQRTVTVGDVIHIPAGEKHWHGATEESAFSHIYVTKATSKTTQLEE